MTANIYNKVAAASPIRDDVPIAWIQWKGTNVCADIRCPCGALAHVDADFAYSIRCGGCGALYGMDPHITLVPLEEADVIGACEPRWSCAGEMGEANGCKCPAHKEPA